MKRKSKITIAKLFLDLIAFGAAAYVTRPFEGWSVLIEHTPEIIVARCIVTPPRLEVETNGVIIGSRGLRDSKIAIIAVLKGGVTNRNVILRSAYWPRQNEDFLIFGQLTDGVFHAYDKYRIIPLGVGFETNMLAGKPLDEQIRLMLDYRLGDLKRKMQEEQEEKQRLEEGLKK